MNTYGKAIVFDTETTSREDDREIIEAAWIRLPATENLAGDSDALPRPIVPDGGLPSLEGYCARFLPEGPITFGSMAVHHIVPSDLVDCPPSSSFALPPDVDYMVGHSIDFDWEAAGKPAIKRICTLAMSHHVWPDADSYSQSALLYMLSGGSEWTRKQLKDAHSAYIDVSNNLELLQAILNRQPEIKTWSQLWAFSERCRVPLRMPIGQNQGYKGMLISEVAEIDPGFCHWCLRQDWIDDYLRTAINRVLGYAEDDAA